MKILFVAMADNVHTARWINQLVDQPWDIHLYPSILTRAVHPALTRVTVHNQLNALLRLATKVNPSAPARYLARLIRWLKPDLIHVLEFQAGGYLLLAAKRYLPENLPGVIVTNWGSDIYYFGRFSEHRRKIKQLLALASYYSCECPRDVALAKKFGFRGEILPVIPNTGGFDLEGLKPLRDKHKTSDRKLILLKGYQGWAGRALTALAALNNCAQQLNGCHLAVFSINPPDSGVVENVLALSQKTGLPVEFIPLNSPHQTILKFHSQARVYLGLSISDALSTSFLESMVMGSFPIQSNTADLSEYLKNGTNGSLVPPDNVEAVARAIRQALLSDQLVNQAYRKNWQIASDKLDERKLKPLAVSFYQRNFR